MAPSAGPTTKPNHPKGPNSDYILRASLKHGDGDPELSLPTKDSKPDGSPSTMMNNLRSDVPVVKEDSYRSLTGRSATVPRRSTSPLSPRSSTMSPPKPRVSEMDLNSSAGEGRSGRGRTRMKAQFVQSASARLQDVLDGAENEAEQFQVASGVLARKVEEMDKEISMTKHIGAHSSGSSSLLQQRLDAVESQLSKAFALAQAASDIGQKQLSKVRQSYSLIRQSARDLRNFTEERIDGVTGDADVGRDGDGAGEASAIIQEQKRMIERLEDERDVLKLALMENMSEHMHGKSNSTPGRGLQEEVKRLRIENLGLEEKIAVLREQLKETGTVSADAPRLISENEQLYKELTDVREEMRRLQVRLKEEEEHVASGETQWRHDHDKLERTYQRKCDELNQSWQSKCDEIDRSWENRLKDQETEWKEKVEILDKAWETRYEEMEEHWKTRLDGINDKMIDIESHFVEEKRGIESRYRQDMHEFEQQLKREVNNREVLILSERREIMDQHEMEKRKLEDNLMQQKKEALIQANEEKRALVNELEMQLEQLRGTLAGERRQRDEDIAVLKKDTDKEVAELQRVLAELQVDTERLERTKSEEISVLKEEVGKLSDEKDKLIAEVLRMQTLAQEREIALRDQSERSKTELQDHSALVNTYKHELESMRSELERRDKADEESRLQMENELQQLNESLLSTQDSLRAQVEAAENENVQLRTRYEKEAEELEADKHALESAADVLAERLRTVSEELEQEKHSRLKETAELKKNVEILSVEKKGLADTMEIMKSTKDAMERSLNIAEEQKKEAAAQLERLERERNIAGQTATWMAANSTISNIPPPPFPGHQPQARPSKSPEPEFSQMSLGGDPSLASNFSQQGWNAPQPPIDPQMFAAGQVMSIQGPNGHLIPVQVLPPNGAMNVAGTGQGRGLPPQPNQQQVSRPPSRAQSEWSVADESETEGVLGNYLSHRNALQDRISQIM